MYMKISKKNRVYRHHTPCVIMGHYSFERLYLLFYNPTASLPSNAKSTRGLIQKWWVRTGNTYLFKNLFFTAFWYVHGLLILVLGRKIFSHEKIDTFEIFESDDDDFKISDIFGSISNIQKIQKIRTLIIAKCSDISILLNLTLNVKSLKLFTLYNFDLVNSLRQFVQSQKNLTDITFSFPPKLFPTYWEIFHSSKTATSTVTFIEFIHIQFPKNISLIYHLALFTNLQYLKFRACDFGYIPNIKEDQLIQEINSNYPLAFKKLNTIIIIEDSYLNLEILKILLQFSGEELLSLELFEVKINKFNYIIKWLEVFCPNLRRLVIVDKTNDKLEIVGIHDFFRKFNNLSYVIINGEKHFVT
uniref:Uncharacterized protein n=1 Tax=Rhizophagus irregularis (strain DAOM 181602 / DAOM 197198 / MUCL 43194) TaxID=747089 RepID=U9TU72_RHIID